MARKRRKTVAASKGDIAEVRSGKASASDKREMGFVKKKGRLVPGKRTPKSIRGAHNARTKKKTRRKKK